MTIYSKDIKTTRGGVKGTRKENREDRILLGGGDFNRRKEERGARNWEEEREDGKRKCRGEETDGMDRRKWMGGIERQQTGGRRRGMDISSRGKQ
jgi:hypothetical protein